MEIHINGPRNTRKPWEKKEAHLLVNLGLKHRSKCPTMNPRSGGPGKMDAQDASGLRFGPSTCPRKANEKIYKLKKDGDEGTQPGCGYANVAAKQA
jgi:hypothetical protein